MYTLNENLNNSWRFLIKLFDDIGKTILLIIFQLIPIINFIVLGYSYEIIEEGDIIEEPPPLQNLGDLFVKGLKIFIIFLLYFIIPILFWIILTLLILSPLILTRIFSLYISGTLPLIIYPTLLFLAYAGSFILGLGVSIFAFMGVIHSIKAGELRKAFAFGEILELIKRVGWDAYLPWVFIMYLIGYVIFSLNNWIIQSILMTLFLVFFGRSAHYIYPES